MPVTTAWTDELLDGMRLRTDPVADAPIRALFERGGVAEVNAVMATLIRVDQPVPEQLPAELRHYLQTTLELPDWADTDKILRGQELFETLWPQITICLFCASLPSSYAAAKGVAVLDRTAELELETTRRRRITETGLFLVDACYVGGLGPDGAGLRTIQKVRLMHAAVRHLIKGRAEQRPEVWNYAELGEPINQEDLAGTRLAFAGAVVDSLPRLGIRPSRDDEEAYLHLWNVIGHLLGIDDELLVRNVDDAVALADTIRRRQFNESRAGKRMTAALLDLLAEITPGQQFDRPFYAALIRHLISDEVADMLNVPPSNFVDELRWFTRLLDWFLVHVLRRPDRLPRLAQQISRKVLRAILQMQRGGDRPLFAVPARLADKWDVET